MVASAVGFYGNRGDEDLTEASGPGSSFLADVCKQWERATESIEQRGIRTVHTRFGVVLSPHGGMLSKLLPLFRLGLGAVVGSGRQWLSWIALEDVVLAIEHLLAQDQLVGPVNVVSPHPETMRAFAQKLAKALRRPLFVRLPAGLVRWVMGQMGEELLLSSTRALPAKLKTSGYLFKFPAIDEYFRQL